MNREELDRHVYRLLALLIVLTIVLGGVWMSYDFAGRSWPRFFFYLTISFLISAPFEFLGWFARRAKPRVDRWTPDPPRDGD